MARPNKIWFRKDTGWWMVTLAGKKIRLAEGKSNRKLAEQKFHQNKALYVRPSERSDARIADVIDKFLGWSRIHRSEETNRNHVWYGQKFSEHAGYLKATELRPHHLTGWVDAHLKWGQTTQRNARRSIYRAFAWAVEEGLLSANPLKGMKCPAARIRQRAMTDGEYRSILRASKRNFKILIFALRNTGARPKEARLLTWDQVHEDRWVLPLHKTAYRTGKPRVIYLTTPMRRLMQVLRRSQPASNEYVFSNARGLPWTVNAMRLRMERVKRKSKLPADLCAYHLRHSFGTSAVLNGVDVVTVAQLMGHSSLEMVQKVYVHLADQHQHLNQAAEQATRSHLAASTPRSSAKSQGDRM